MFRYAVLCLKRFVVLGLVMLRYDIVLHYAGCHVPIFSYFYKKTSFSYFLAVGDN